MSVTASMIWFIFMATATTTILVVGTLGAAGLLTRDERTARPARRAAVQRLRQREAPK
jgi:hypothetical protein